MHFFIVVATVTKCSNNGFDFVAITFSRYCCFVLIEMEMEVVLQ